MPIEVFHETYPADAAFARNLMLRPEAWKGGSSVRIMANVYRNEAVAALTDSTIEELTTTDRQVSFLTNYAGIHFANTLLSIEDTIRTGEFNAVAYRDGVLGDFAKTGKPTDLVFPEARVEQVPQESLDRMMLFASRDRTFGAFFANGLQVIPETLKKYLLDAEILYSIRTLVLPGYVDRVKLLIAHKDAIRAQQSQPAKPTF